MCVEGPSLPGTPTLPPISRCQVRPLARLEMRLVCGSSLTSRHGNQGGQGLMPRGLGNAGAVMAAIVPYRTPGPGPGPSPWPLPHFPGGARRLLVGWVGDCRVVLSGRAGTARTPLFSPHWTPHIKPFETL